MISQLLSDPFDSERFLWQWMVSAAFWTSSWLAISVVLELLLQPKPKSDPNAPKKAAESIIAIIHAVVAVFSSSWLLLTEDADIGQPLTSSQRSILIMSSGYFLHDLLFCIIFKDVAAVAHHLASLAAEVSVIYFGVCGTEMLTALTLCEMSGPLINFLVVSHIISEEKSFDCVGVIFVMFVIARFAVWPLFLFKAFGCPSTLPILKVSAICIIGFSLCWSSRIFKVASKAIASGKFVSTFSQEMVGALCPHQPDG